MQQCCEGFRMTNLYSQPVTAVYSHHFCAFPTDYDEVSDVYSHAGRRLLMSFCVFHNCISIPFIEGDSFQPVAYNFSKLQISSFPSYQCSCPGPVIPPEALSAGESDLVKIGLHGCTQQKFRPNYHTLMSRCVQVGNDSKALPIVLQLIGCPWEEATLLHVATAFEVQFA
ncbi:unnamed protein product [Sphagnum tenellum]